MRYKHHVLSDVNEENKVAQCSICGLVSVKKNNKNLWRCTNARSKKHVAEGKRRYSKGDSTIQKRYKLIREIKNVPCFDCGNSFPACCMDFDHRNPGEKIVAVSQLYCASLEKLMAEIDKCDIVCSNCHRIREHNRRK